MYSRQVVNCALDLRRFGGGRKDKDLWLYCLFFRLVCLAEFERVLVFAMAEIP